MTVEEVVALGGSMDAKSTESCPSWINTANFWLGSARSTDYVWGVFGERGRLRGNGFFRGRNYGVRPVIEISKSLI